MSRIFIPITLSLFLFTHCSTDKAKPNVIILYTDDHRYNTVNELGNKEIKTPHMDKLAREGVSFTRAHIMGGRSGALCVPSRAMLNTGRYVNDLEGAGNRIPAEHISMPETFAKAGYTTFFTGKWHNDKASLARIFQTGENVYIGGMHWPTDGGHFNPQLHHWDPTGEYSQENIWEADEFSSTMYANAAIDFIEQQTEPNPFYICVAFTSPHDPRTPPADFEKLYNTENVSLPENYLPEHPFDNGDLKTRDEKLAGWPRTEEIVKNELALYYGMISEVDAQIGRIIATLEKQGLRENTIIVFAGDNGLAVGSHGLMGKQNVYDHSMRVPMIFTGPGIPKNERRKSFVYIPDIFPTLAGMTGIDIPETVTGKDLDEVIRDDTPVRENVYYIYRDVQRAVRTDDNWKIIKYLVKGKVTTQLFNLNDDPFEINNLAEDPEYREKLKEMEEILASEMKNYGDDLDPSKPYFGKKMPVRGPQKVFEEPRLTENATVEYLTEYSSVYPAAGDDALIDGKLGMAEDFNENWQAFEQNDMDLIIDLGEVKDISKIEASIVSAQGAWIFLPSSMTFQVSNDKKNWTTTGSFEREIEKTDSQFLELFTSHEKTKARYIRVNAKNIGECPDWHPAAGGKAWLFIDEIIVQ